MSAAPITEIMRQRRPTFEAVIQSAGVWLLHRAHARATTSSSHAMIPSLEQFFLSIFGGINLALGRRLHVLFHSNRM